MQTTPFIWLGLPHYTICRRHLSYYASLSCSVIGYEKHPVSFHFDYWSESELQKSSLVPINVTTERCAELAQIISCKPEALPFTYLGLPMGTTKPKLQHLISLLERID